MYDVVVVGAGPAGSRFARQAAAAGDDVIVLEAGEIGKPLACSGHVSLDIWKYVPDDARDRLFQNAIRGARFHLSEPDGEPPRRSTPSESRVEWDGERTDGYVFYKQEPVSNAIDRVGLDKTLARAARERGAEVRDGYTVTSVNEYAGGVEVTARGPDGFEQFDGALVCGADGPRSKVRDEVGLPEPDEFLHGILGFAGTTDHQEFVDVHLTVPRFFAWRIPRGEAGVEYGLAVAPGDDASGRFDRFLEMYDVDVERRCSGVIPIGPPTQTVGKRSFLIGDAAGQTKPFTGGGILYGMRAADIAANTIDPTQPATLDCYERRWRNELGREQAVGKLVRAGYSLPKPLQRTGMRVFDGEIAVHMDRPTSLFSRAQLRAMLSWH